MLKSVSDHPRSTRSKIATYVLGACLSAAIWPAGDLRAQSCDDAPFADAKSLAEKIKLCLDEEKSENKSAGQLTGTFTSGGDEKSLLESMTSPISSGFYSLQGQSADGKRRAFEALDQTIDQENLRALGERFNQ